MTSIGEGVVAGDPDLESRDSDSEEECVSIINWYSVMWMSLLYHYMYVGVGSCGTSI